MMENVSVSEDQLPWHKSVSLVQVKNGGEMFVALSSMAMSIVPNSYPLLSYFVSVR
jgi:hypothetical protein